MDTVGVDVNVDVSVGAKQLSSAVGVNNCVWVCEGRRKRGHTPTNTHTQTPTQRQPDGELKIYKLQMPRRKSSWNFIECKGNSNGKPNERAKRTEIEPGTRNRTQNWTRIPARRIMQQKEKILTGTQFTGLRNQNFLTLFRWLLRWAMFSWKSKHG